MDPWWSRLLIYEAIKQGNVADKFASRGQRSLLSTIGLVTLPPRLYSHTRLHSEWQGCPVPYIHAVIHLPHMTRDNFFGDPDQRRVRGGKEGSASPPPLLWTQAPPPADFERHRRQILPALWLRTVNSKPKRKEITI